MTRPSQVREIRRAERGPPAGPASPPFPDVAVLLGDPRLPDASKPGGRYTPEDLEAVERLRAALGELDRYRFAYLDDHATLLRRLAEGPPSFVLNFCDTGYRNDARRESHLPALLELLDVPYSGAGPGALELCYDKAKVGAIAAAAGVPVPRETFVDATRLAAGGPVPGPPPFPVLVKPVTGDGSVGITAASLAGDAGELREALRRLGRDLPGRDALVQEFLPGTEVAIGLIGNPESGHLRLPVLEVDYEALDPDLPRLLAYESKAVAASPYWRQLRYREARIEPDTVDRLAGWSALLCARLGCRDYARVDFRADAGGEFRLLEVNPNPAWCWDGKLNLMAGFAGLSYAELLGLLLEAAQTRATGGPRSAAPRPDAG